MYKGMIEKKGDTPISSSLRNLLEDFGRRLSRIEAALRDGMHPASDGDSFAFGAGRVNRRRFAFISRKKEFVRLSPRELALLEMFVEHPNEVLSRDMLMSRLWGVDFYGNTRTLDQHVNRIRQKLGADGARIITFSRVGYAYESDVHAALRV